MTPSRVLTRSIFRAIAANRPYVFAECHRSNASRIRPILQKWHPALSQHRHIFGIGFGATQRSLRHGRNTSLDLEYALGLLVDLMRARRSSSKPPPPDKVLEAFNYLFRSRLEAPRRFTRNEVYLATETVKHLQELQNEDGEQTAPTLSEDDLYTALASLAAATGREKFRSDTQALAYLIFQELRAQSESTNEGSNQADDSRPTGPYITILSRTGGARKAQELLGKSPSAGNRDSMTLWLSVIKGLATEGLEKEALMMIENMQSTLGPLNPLTHEDLTTFLAAEDKITLMQRVYKLEMENGSVPTTHCNVMVAKCCIHNKLLEWGRPIFEALAMQPGNHEAENVLLQFAVLKGVQINQLSDVLKKPLTIGEVNSLLEYAYTVNDKNLSGELLGYINTNGLRSDARTFVLQLDHNVKSGAILSSISTFNQLCSEDVPQHDSDIPVLNRLLAALCFQEHPETEVIMRIVDRLLDRRAEIDAEALAGLCYFYLQSDELSQILGLIRHRADSYPAAERARIAAVFREFIINPAVDHQRAFNAYELFRHAFPETPVTQRVPLMNSFFHRGRPDLACLIFGHMRQREDSESRPTAAAYAACFQGLATSRYFDGVQMIYNMLKLDLEVEQRTRIHNALMAAYTSCELPERAIIEHFWKVMDSREGPTMSSFALALRACENFVPQGAQEARRIIAMMQVGGLDISREIYHCYIGALAGQSEFENTIELIEEMENDIGEKPDAITIGTFYNAIPWQYRKDEVERWARQAYPELWEALEAFGDDIDEEWEVRTFRIPRDIDMEDESLFDQGEYDPLLAQETQYLLEMSNR